ncbi:NAD-dependent epimerase/dehydratase family protein [Neptunomonas phycophila]|uniref:NAD-dependent epimerase/dehydratase family protein n=1 Tax=Neptunomonas phycophila TaxID=1572645 RepID=A0AAW7XIA4_9GAMM|nr:NAD-dependent epimerase/dehydratase family protein [Neptunomonas phycophila]MDO6452814.1 NAD-dependent epimerase/dehydratase family protein [Neptunomonas phycophila]
MHVVITGANGFVGQALTNYLLSMPPSLKHEGEVKAVSELTLIDRHFDSAFPSKPVKKNVTIAMHSGDLADQTWLSELLKQSSIDVIFHLASIPGGMAEQNEALARQVNIDATITLLEACKMQTLAGQGKPRLVFASSIAVFGQLPERITDATPLNPQLSYGAHKVVGEVMINDFSRRGWVDGRSLRLPGVLARPPAETGQLSAFLSDIIRQVSQGHAFVCPMSPQAKTWASSLPNVVENLMHAAIVEESKMEAGRTFTLPTLCFSMAELVSATGSVYQQKAHELVRYDVDPMIEQLFGCFPPLETPKADRAGFKHDGDLKSLVERALPDKTHS